MDNVIDLSQAPAMLFWFRIVSGLTIWVNILCLYLIAVATPRGLGNFRWHMFALHFIDDSFSVLPNVLRVRGSLLAFPMLGLPAQGGFAIGPLADCGFDVYWQLIVLIYVTVAVVSSTQILGFIRQQSVLKNEHFLKLKPRNTPTLPRSFNNVQVSGWNLTSDGEQSSRRLVSSSFIQLYSSCWSQQR
ncbi:unnamed protein product, partial [Mesorhabditis belari]|uniref:Uncharacterized protein n=1 Tax=Mesorhabditis belari TaxID=2138241 RepID=A0AAF3FCS4_9BILA